MQHQATEYVHEQLSLIPGKRKPVSKPVALDRIYTLSNTHEAMLYGCELGCVAAKNLAGEMRCGKSVWSRIVNGELDLDARDILPFNTIVGNNATLLYLNHIHGVDLKSIRMVLDDKDRVIADLQQAVADRDRLLAIALAPRQGRS